MNITYCYGGLMTKKTPFGEALKFYRKQQGNLGQERLAEIVGCKQSMISDIERGVKPGSDSLRNRIVEHFKVSYCDFIAKGEEILGIYGDKKSQQITMYDKPVQKHIELVKKFKNKDMALTANELLLELDRMGIKALSKAITAIDAVLEEEKGKYPPGKSHPKKDVANG